MAFDGKLKDFGSGSTRVFLEQLSKSAHLPFEKIDHSVFHILLAPQQTPGLLFQYPEMTRLSRKGDTTAVIVEAEYRFEEKNTSLLPQTTTVRPVAPLNFHNDPAKPSSETVSTRQAYPHFSPLFSKSYVIFQDLIHRTSPKNSHI